MLKKIIILNLSVLFLIGCDKTAQTTANTNAAAPKIAADAPVVSGHSQTAGNTNGAPQNPSDVAVVPKSETKTKWTQSGNPIETSAFDREIAETEKNLKAKAKDETARKAVAEAYLKRAVALTEARQYASALGDYRRVLKYDANNEEAETWIKQILEIYAGLNKEAPPAGEEPPPLPIQKKI